MNPYFPIITLTLTRADTGLQAHNAPRLTAFRDTIFNAIWAEQQNVNNPSVVAAVIAKAGFDRMALIVLADGQLF